MLLISGFNLSFQNVQQHPQKENRHFHCADNPHLDIRSGAQVNSSSSLSSMENGLAFSTERHREPTNEILASNMMLRYLVSATAKIAAPHAAPLEYGITCSLPKCSGRLPCS